MQNVAPPSPKPLSLDPDDEDARLRYPRLSVLIVDDQTSARTMMYQVLQGLMPRLQLVEFADPFQALAWCQSHSVDLLLLSQQLPGMNGLELTRRLRCRACHRDIPIVLLMMSDDPVAQLTALDAGVMECLVKPVRPRDLRARCYNFLQLRLHYENIRRRALALEQQWLRCIRDVHEREQEALARLARALEYRDLGTSAYLERMSHIARLIADELGMSTEQARLIEMAAMLHDIGKVAIPDAVLHKQGVLSPQELAIMRQHSRIGYDLLSQSPNQFIQVGAVIALRHHERYDGSGYPDGLVGEAIPIEARIAAVADVVDALLCPRPYKVAWSLDATLGYLYVQRGRLFDPCCVDALIRGRPTLNRICEEFTAPSSPVSVAG